MSSYFWRIMISLVLTVGLLLVCGPIFPPQPSSLMISSLFWTNKVYPDKAFDVVFIGDSRIYRGIDPEKVREELAELGSFRVFNFGFSSAGLDSVLLDAGAALLDKQSAKPIIVLGVNSSSLADENMVNRHYRQEKNRPLMELWQRKYVNPYFSFFDPTLPSVLRNKYRGKKAGYYQEYQLNGWVASDKLPRDVWATYWMTERSCLEGTFSPSIRKNLIKKVAEWEKNGIEVFAFRPPAAKHFEAIETKEEYFPEQAIIAQFEAAGGTWIDITKREEYTTYDGNHLEKKSAQRLSSFIGKAIKKSLKLPTKSNLKFSSFQNFDKTIAPPWGELEESALTKKDAFSGQTAHLLKPKSFSSTYVKNLDSLLRQNLYISASCWMKSEKSAQDSKIVLVVSVQDGEEVLLWQGQQFVEQTLDKTAWNRIQLSTDYLNDKKGCLLKIYVWNDSEAEVLMDDFRIEIKQR